MRKKLLFAVVFFMGFAIKAFPQDLNVIEFRLNPIDFDAKTCEKKDYNHKPCGLVKVSLPIPGVTFEGSIYPEPSKFPPEFKNGEYWVYMIEDSKKLTIKAPGYHPLRCEFDNRIQGGNTYILTIEIPRDPNTIKNSSAMWRSAILPGLGQFYKNRNGRGTLIVIGETLTLAAGGLSLYNELTQKNIMDKPEVSYQDYIAAEKSYEQWNTARHISFITAAVIYALNLADAYFTPAKPQKNLTFAPNVLNTNGELAVGATLSIRF